MTSRGHAEATLFACPTCAVQLDEAPLDGEVVRRCPRCGGIYFGPGQLESIVHIVRLFQSIHLEEEDIDSVSEEERARILCCPMDGTPMTKLGIAGLALDQCSSCRGIWLDDGEIAALKMAETHIRGNIQLYIRLGR